MRKEPFKARIADIRVPPRLRPIDPATVDMLAASFLERGQDTRIIVREDGGPDRYVLIAGAHRLAAAAQIEWAWIDAEMVDADDDEARLIEIDENLVRRELSVLDRAIFLAERKAVWERRYPETAHGKARKTRQGKVANLATFARFSKEASERTGLSERTVRRATQLIEGLTPEVRDGLRLSPLADNQTQLFALAAMRPETQVVIAREIAEGRASTVAAATLTAGLAPRRNIDPNDAKKAKFLKDWARSNRAMRAWIREFVNSRAAADVPVAGEDEAG
jgi:ParB family chromosome partitioning protein